MAYQGKKINPQKKILISPKKIITLPKKHKSSEKEQELRKNCQKEINKIGSGALREHVRVMICQGSLRGK